MYDSLNRFYSFFRGSMIECYCGLTKAKTDNDENPEDCAYVRIARENMIKSGEIDTLKVLLKDLLEALP